MKKNKKSSRKVKKNDVKSKPTKKRQINMENIYKTLNQVQMDKKKKTLKIQKENVQTIENIIKDLDLEYEKKVGKKIVTFNLKPIDNNDDLDFLDIEYLEDEIPPEGQIFG